MSATRWSKFLAEVQAERLSSGCPGCANLARLGAPAQCNYHRTNAPDRLAQDPALIAQFAGQPDPQGLALDALGA